MLGGSLHESLAYIDPQSRFCSCCCGWSKSWREPETGILFRSLSQCVVIQEEKKKKKFSRATKKVRRRKVPFGKGGGCLFDGGG